VLLRPAAPLPAARVIQFAAANFSVGENLGQVTVIEQRMVEFDPDGNQFSRNHAGFLEFDNDR